MSESYYGTSNFRSFADAYNYYRPYGWDANEVNRKVSDGEIHIGRAKNLGNNETFSWDKDGRGVITITE